MKTTDFDKQVSEALATVNLHDEKTIQEAANMLLGQNNVKVGDKVAVLHDETYPFDGQTGKIKALGKGDGFAEVEFANGVTVSLQASLLVPV